jgi:glycosyltransferase involved in cell wall biosynthesis
MSRVSVIIPSYNRAGLVGETIENMLRQSRPPSEVIVVDDGSTDESVRVIRSFGDRVKLVIQTNQGPGAARNRGMASSSGEFIQFMDSDDLASLNKLEVQLTAIKESDADFAYCPWVRTELHKNKLRFAGPLMQARPIPEWKSMLEWQMGNWCLVFQNCLFRRTILEKAGAFRTDLMPSEDSEYLVRILLAGARTVFTKDCLVFYRVHPGGQITTSGTNAGRRAADWTRYLEVVGEEVREHLDAMHRSTQLEIALNVYRHIGYCRDHGWPEPAADSPFCRLAASIPKIRLRWADLSDRLYRKLVRLPSDTPNSRGLMLLNFDRYHCELAGAAGFEVVNTLDGNVQAGALSIPST